MFKLKKHKPLQLKSYKPLQAKCIWKDEHVDLIVNNVYDVMEYDYENGLIKLIGEEGNICWYREKYLEVIY